MSASDPLAPWRPHVAALRAFHDGRRDATLVVHDDFGRRDTIPAAVFFRAPDAFFPVEDVALDWCAGRVLDVGAGAGCHALALQDRGASVTAIDLMPDLVAIMRERGVRDARAGTMDNLVAQGESYDTLLMLMNGLGLAGTLAGLVALLAAADALLAPGGQLLADSTDLREGYGELRWPRRTKRSDGRYIGEIVFQLEWAGERAPAFPQLYVDPTTLAKRVRALGWTCSVLAREDAGAFLVRMQRA